MVPLNDDSNVTVPRSIPSSAQCNEVNFSRRGNTALTGRGGDKGVRFNVDATGRVVRRELEVADRNPREAIERLERDVLAEFDTVEDRPECRQPECIRRDRPCEIGVVQ